MDKVIYEFKKTKYNNEISVYLHTREQCEELCVSDKNNVQKYRIDNDADIESFLNGWAKDKGFCYRVFVC